MAIQPQRGDGKLNLLYKIAQNTYDAVGNTGNILISDVNGLQSALDGKLGLSANSYVIARPGDNLATKYGEAKVLTPQGNARSATNRASLIILPGTYSLAAELAIDTEFVDIIGLGAQFQSPAVIVTNNTLNITANDVRVSGVSVGTQAFKIANNKPLQKFENCVGGNNSFAGNGGTASGTFAACVGGDDSFGGYDIEQSSTASFLDCVAGNESFGGNAGDYPSAKYISCRLTSGSFPTIYIPGRARFCLDEDYNIVNADGGYDTDADSYFTTAGVTDDTAKDQLNLFVIGVKRLGLWDDMVCWPLRSAQNAGTGSTAYSLGGLGTYNGTLVNGPTWGVDGIDFVAASSQRISTSLVAQIRSLGSVYDATSNGSDLTLLSNRNDSIWVNGLSLFAREANDNQCLIDVAGTNARIRATRTPVFGQFVFSQATATDAGSSDASQTTYRQDKNSRSSGSYVIGTNEPMGSSGTALTIAASGPTGGSQFFNGNMAFSFISTQFFSSSQQESFFDLYKSTLGQGLGLP